LTASSVGSSWRRLLNDPDIDLADKISGSFVLLYAQPLSRIAVMTFDQITVTRLAWRSVSPAQSSPSQVDSAALLAAHMATAAPETSASARSRTAGSSRPPSWAADHRSISANVSARSGSMLELRAAQPNSSLPAKSRRCSRRDARRDNPTAVAWVHAAGGDWANYAALVTEDNAQC